MQYYTLSTNAGDSAIAKAIQSGTMAVFSQLAVGDGGGSYYEPSKSQTALRHEVWRGNAEVSLDPNKENRIIVMAIIPANVGGFLIREASVMDASGTVLAIAKMPLSEKTDPSSGSSTDYCIKLYVEVADAAVVAVTVDPSAIMATKLDVRTAKEELSEMLSEHSDNGTIHITAEERTAWNAKETPTGAQAKADAAKAAAIAAIPASLPANGGTSSACSGNAATATKLLNPRMINGVAFDGSVNINISAPASGGNASYADSAGTANYANSAGSAPANGGNANYANSSGASNSCNGLTFSVEASPPGSVTNNRVTFNYG